MRHKNHPFRDLLEILNEAVSENYSSLVKGSSTRSLLERICASSVTHKLVCATYSAKYDVQMKKDKIEREDA
jgi:hypothetical protein